MELSKGEYDLLTFFIAIFKYFKDFSLELEDSKSVIPVL